MRKILCPAGVLLALSACGGGNYTVPSPTAPGYTGQRGQDGMLIVTRDATPFTYSDGAEARRAADKLCGASVNSSPEDNFQNGAWVFPGGCR